MISSYYRIKRMEVKNPFLIKKEDEQWYQWWPHDDGQDRWLKLSPDPHWADDIIGPDKISNNLANFYMAVL